MHRHRRAVYPPGMHSLSAATAELVEAGHTINRGDVLLLDVDGEQLERKAIGIDAFAGTTSVTIDPIINTSSHTVDLVAIRKN